MTTHITKTWFDGDKVVTQEIPESEVYKQEPVALEAVYETIIHWDEGGGKRSRRELARRIVALYTTPPAAQRPWVGLTDEEIKSLPSWWPSYNDQRVLLVLIRDIQAKLKEKNT